MTASRTELITALPSPPPRWWVTVAGNLLLAAVYLGVAWVSLAAATEHRLVSSLWPPAGIALFALLRYGIRFWPGIALGAFVLTVSSDIGVLGAAVIAAGDAFEAVVAAHIIGRLMGRRRTLSRVKNVFTLALIGGGLTSMISATVGVATLVATGGTTMASAWSLWRVWWTGDAVGVLVVTPLLLAWTMPEQPLATDRQSRVEGALLFLALALMTDYLFSHVGVLVFAILPVAVLISWRLGPRAAATVSAVVTLIAALRTLAGYGPFTIFSPTENLFALQLFLAILALMNLAFAAAHAESAYVEGRLRASEARYRMLAQKLPDGAVVLYDRDLRVALMEGPAVEAAGFLKGDIEGKHLPDLFDATQTAFLSRHFRDVFSGEEVEFEATRGDRSYLVRVLPVDDVQNGLRVGMALVLDVTERDHAQRAVAESRAQLEQLSRLLLTAQEDERRRVAREVHDELGQALTAVKIGIAQNLKGLGSRSTPESDRLRHVSDTLDRAIGSVQQIVLRLRPGVLDNLGPLAALEHEVDQFRERSQLSVALSLPPDPMPIGPTESTVLYRTVQEALTNVLRHAHARHVAVSLTVRDDEFVLQVTDDGVGIAESQLRKPRSMGLLGMRERAASCGGRLDIVRVETGGTCVMLSIPRRLNGAEQS